MHKSHSSSPMYLFKIWKRKHNTWLSELEKWKQDEKTFAAFVRFT